MEGKKETEATNPGDIGKAGVVHTDSPKKAPVLLVVGMAGSGKTTLMQVRTCSP